MVYSVEEPTLWDEPTATSVHTQAEQLQSTPGGPTGYRLRRVILTNFWLYDHQEFEIPHGRLFLAGENASGKSTVLTAALPLALDGDFRPERIDTFGKREKRIDYYVLGSNESATPFSRDQRTSYVALEFEWCDMHEPPFASELRAAWERGEYDQARFLTIGIVFAGNRNSVNPITALRFLITDGSRLDLENGLRTVNETRDGRRAYDLKTFRKMLVDHGIACDTQREYEQKVAQYLFNFSDVNDFRRLIRQLLYLRQPNLNSVLSLEAVRKYLDQSLPQIPGDLIQHAATTLELMDTLREELERKAKAYQATEKLHNAQETLISSKVRLAACEYVHEHFKEQEALGYVRRHKGNLTRAENELARTQSRLEELALERSQIAGEIAALEGSEGLQAAQRLNQVSEKVAELERKLKEQLSILDDAIGSREQSYQEVEQQQKEFLRTRQENEQQLQLMRNLAQQDARWEIATDQLAETLQRVQQITLNDTAPHVSTSITSLLEAQVNDRLDWLRVLRQLHQDVAHATTRLQAAQRQETHYYDEVDEATRQFEQDRENVCVAQQSLATILDALVEQSDLLQASQFAFIHERATQVCNDALPPQEALEQFSTLLHDYRTAIQAALDSLHTSINQLQRSLNDLRQQQGAREHEVELAKAAYQQKLLEPEFTPARSEHRQRARKQLAAHGIPALPFYKLVDFAPGIDNQSRLAGSIEYMLEDAGLLDALVVPSAYTVQADELLAAEGLSDCRLNIAYIAEADWEQAPTTPFPILRGDPALMDESGASYAEWAETLQPLLVAMNHADYTPLSMDGDTEQGGHWEHGLLTGQAGGGKARCIGKATRIREQQEAQEILRQRWQQLARELQDIVEQIIQAEQGQQELKTQQGRMDNALRESMLEARYAALQTTLEGLHKAQERYHRARAETQELRQHINSMRTQLQRESGDIALFASDLVSVEDAYEATNKLFSEHKALQRHLDHLLKVWQAHKRANDLLDKARVAEIRAANAHKRAEQETAQARSELSTLERLVKESASESIDNLLERLKALQGRQNDLPEQMQKARDTQTRAEMLFTTSNEELEKAQGTLQLAEQRRTATYNHFAILLGSYPVERLLLAQQALITQSPVDTAQSLLDEPLLPQEEVYVASKLTLDTKLNRANSLLFQTNSEVGNLLHEYGPRIDEQNFIHFINADNANAFELLTRLAEEIKQQERLLEDKERVLFQDFLLKEMADTVRKHIVDAEGWVDKINTVLNNTSFIEEHYHLRWVTKEQDQTQPGSYLAQYHKLLRRQAQTFQQEEIDALVYAFRQEIAILRANQQEATGIPFAEALAQVFDYRSWFRFEIYVTTPDGQPQHLSDRLLKKRSGAEQYVALYVPFFAALSALYESAGKGAPRLIALDEAFDKVSVGNTQRLLKFLDVQEFQWIMTGPRITGEGTELPACVRYLMLHQKGTELATGFASFWSNTQPSEGEIG